MAPNALFYQLLFAALVLVCLIIHGCWPDPLRAAPPPPVAYPTAADNVSGSLASRL
jgi:hypothetical protein